MCDNLCWPFYLVSIMLFKMRHLWSCSLICSIFRKICCKPDIPAPNEEKPQQVKYIPSSFTQLFFIQLIMITNHFLMCAVKQFLGDEYFQPHDPEELQPYASYVQRVNSIYNSSAELFNAWITPDLHECTKTFLIKADLWCAYDVMRFALGKCIFISAHLLCGWNYTRVLVLLLMRADETLSKEHPPLCRLWWEKHQPEWVKVKEWVETEGLSHDLEMFYSQFNSQYKEPSVRAV